jgi:hypothetical protein
MGTKTVIKSVIQKEGNYAFIKAMDNANEFVAKKEGEKENKNKK